MTYNDIVTRALRLIGVLYETETTSAEQGVDALSQLNAMMSSWEMDGIRIGYFSGDSTTDTIAIEPRYRVAIEFNLAMLLAPQFERQPPPVVVQMAADSYNKLLLEAVQANREESVPLMHRGEGAGYFVDIFTQD